MPRSHFFWFDTLIIPQFQYLMKLYVIFLALRGFSEIGKTWLYWKHFSEYIFPQKLGVGGYVIANTFFGEIIVGKIVFGKNFFTW